MEDKDKTTSPSPCQPSSSKDEVRCKKGRYISQCTYHNNEHEKSYVSRLLGVVKKEKMVEKSLGKVGIGLLLTKLYICTAHRSKINQKRQELDFYKLAKLDGSFLFGSN